MAKNLSKQVASKVSPQNYEGEDFEAIKRIAESQKNLPLFKVKHDAHGKPSLKLDCDDQALGYVKLMESTGTTDVVFFETLMTQLANSTSSGDDFSEATMNFALSLVQSIEPRDQLEALLASQMATAHICAMAASRKYHAAEYVKQQEDAEKAMNKFNRTFALQIEALRKHRNGGKQTVRVEKVVVHEGGQAVVGDVHHRGGYIKNDG